MKINAFVLRTTWAAATLTVLAVACDSNSELAAPPAIAAAQQTLTLEVSNASAARGQTIAVAIDAGALHTLGGVQGTLRFDATRLKYRGQIRNGDQEIALVNASAAERGQLRLAVLNPA